MKFTKNYFVAACNEKLAKIKNIFSWTNVFTGREEKAHNVWKLASQMYESLFAKLFLTALQTSGWKQALTMPTVLNNQQ